MKRKYLSIVSFVLVLLILFTGCLPAQTRKTQPTTQEQNGTSLQTTDGNANTTAQATTQAGPPQVITYYELNKTQKVDDYFTAGFDVKLPKIVSDKPGALAINADIDKLRVNLVNYYNSAGPITAFTEYFKYSYESSLKSSVIFIALYTAYGIMESEYTTDNFYYAYDYLADKNISNKDIGLMFSLNESQILNMVNTELNNRNTPTVSGFDKIDLFVNANGQLVADAKVESMMGGFYSEIIILP